MKTRILALAAITAVTAAALSFGAAPASAGGGYSVTFSHGYHGGHHYKHYRGHRRHYRRGHRHYRHGYRHHRRWHRVHRHHYRYYNPPPVYIYKHTPAPVYRAPAYVPPVSAPVKTVKIDERYCREYTRDVIVDGKPAQAYGTACRQPDGSWKIVRED